MGKFKKMTMAKQTRTSLGQQIVNNDAVKNSGRQKLRNRQDDEDDTVNTSVVDDRISKRILVSARIQQDELEEELGVAGNKVRPKVPNLSKDHGESSDSESESDFGSDDDDGDYKIEDIGEDDEKAFALFMNSNPPVRRTLADIIMEKITEKQTEINTQFTDKDSLEKNCLDERVVRMYESVGKILSKYRSGKLPTAFKMIPSSSNWKQLLVLTDPDKWSAAAVYAATRIFTSNLKENEAQMFFSCILLPRVRDDIKYYKRLNVHLYQALHKSLFKPGAFYKGIVLPLCRSCTLRETVIISSVIAKNSIPALHSAVAILKLAEMNYTAANSIFIQTILRKQYALPYRVIDGLVHHFLGFRYDNRTLPVLWHQSLLTFIQHYKQDISEDQKEAISELLKVHTHTQITPEITKELQNSKSRGDEVMQTV